MTEETIFTTILQKELLTALGCTEPTCIAYCAAEMRHALGREPQKMYAECSGNLIKNAKGATVPNSDGMKGIEAAAVLGAVGGDPALALEVLTVIKPEDIRRARELLAQNICTVSLMENEEDKLHVIIRGEADGHFAEAELKHTHTGISCVKRDNKVLFENSTESVSETDNIDALCSHLSVRKILEFAKTVDPDASGLRPLILKQVSYNSAISREGLARPYGACVGQVLLKRFGTDIHTRAAAMPAAGSDARMSGCELPVVINSGSGNQGITVSLPVVEYAKELNKSEDEMVRALIVGNLVAIHIKTAYGRLSAFCGAVSAAAGAGAAITWLSGGTYEQICGTIVNTLGTISGMVCDGAKPSCAGKIASAVTAAVIAHTMSMESKHFVSGDGLVKGDVEQTIQTVGKMASEGMVETDDVILHLMME